MKPCQKKKQFLLRLSCFYCHNDNEETDVFLMLFFPSP